jgi:hypothetical protein
MKTPAVKKSGRAQRRASTVASPPVKSEITTLALFDVLGFESRIKQMGLERLKAAYDSLIAVVRRTMKVDFFLRSFPSSDGSSHSALGVFPTEYAYFSDTIIVWQAYDAFPFPSFCQMCCEFMCESLRVRLPVRGALAVGPAILDKGSGVYLGSPLVEAARMESAQRWLGVSFCNSFFEPHKYHFTPELVIPYSEHFKPEEKTKYAPGLVLDWPRRWREQGMGEIAQAISALDTDERFHDYYANTLAFVAHSKQQHDWFKHKQNAEALGVATGIKAPA